MKDIDLYFITDSKLTRKSVVEDAKAAVKAGVKIIQYREKDSPTLEMIKEAEQIKEICKGKASLIINDRIDIALAVDADGVHLGQDDMPYEIARKLLPNKIIGLTVHNIDEAKHAKDIGADYLGVSPIFATSTKLDAGKPAGLTLIQDIKKAVNLPLVGIGGIDLNNVSSVIKAGADSAAVISAIITKDNVQSECEKFIRIIKDTRKR
ncbi:MAG: thiamine phosphate synthase [Nanoarchaeota archaeon]|nr:thiamine phosphate synthase [Nanoarchaeota archaeon]MBU1705036.1 thiamine phosphate synthase [Nanoarchaeota archaeon]